MKVVDTIFKEIRRGENLDIYLTILLAVVVAILGILQIASFEIISAVILATLGLMASSLLTSRRSVTEMSSSFDKLASTIKTLEEKIQKTGHISDSLSKSYPDLTEQLRKARRVSIEGSTLGSIVTRYSAEFVQLLKRGGSLRFLVSAPVPEVLAMQMFRSSSIKDPAIMTNSMNSNMAMLKTIGEKTSYGESFEIRTMPYLASYSLAIIEGDDGITRAYVKLLSVQQPDPEFPTFEVHSRYDSSWYEFFADQFEKMWQSAQIA